MKMKALDSFHTSGLGSVHAGQEFEVHDALGKEIAAKGLAVVTEESTDTSAGADSTDVATPKSLPEPEAKMEPLSANKMEVAPANKRGPGRRLKSKRIWSRRLNNAVSQR
jgi:hypothetical protein